MHNLIVTFASLVAIVLANPSDTLGHGGYSNVNYGAVISATSGYPAPEYQLVPKEGENIYRSAYKAPDYLYGTGYKDTIFVKPERTVHPHSKYNEKVLRKAYNDYIDNKLALKKRIFTSLVQKTVDKTVDVTASLTKNVVDFLTKISIDAAANLAKNGAKAVIHKKEEKYKGNVHHY